MGRRPICSTLFPPLVRQVWPWWQEGLQMWLAPCSLWEPRGRRRWQVGPEGQVEDTQHTASTRFCC